MKKATYVLGTGLSHDGSSCLLKDGKVCVAIEKERITRVKHDGLNDSQTIKYCLDAEGIQWSDLDLVVQNALFGNFRFGSEYYRGSRYLNEHHGVPVVTISHHLAHAYSAVGTCPFDEFDVLVMDGCGNSFNECMDLAGASIPDRHMIELLPHLYNEKDSFYSFRNNRLAPVVKDFSEWGLGITHYSMHPPVTKHSIGGLYAAVSTYCFGTMVDTGKLMGLGPYGRPGKFSEEIFELLNGRVFLNYDWMAKFQRPARSFDIFKRDFQYYADIAYGVQLEIERAVEYIFRSRVTAYGTQKLCYAGGTALNALANSKLLSTKKVQDLYIEPASGDNGLALGCAYYGWLEVLKRERITHNGSTCFGVEYSHDRIQQCINTYKITPPAEVKAAIDLFFEMIPTCVVSQPDSKGIVQFNIEDYGVYQVKLSNPIHVWSDVVESPTCTIKMKGDFFYKALLTKNGFHSLLTNNAEINASNKIDAAIFLQSIDLERIFNFVRTNSEKTVNPGLKIISTVSYIDETARLLAEGSVIGWFQDGSEFGPRALGRRSILADPRQSGVRDFINSQIKLREDFRPFAPSVLAEDVSLYFKNGHDSPYMIMVDEIRPEWEDKIKSVVHLNKTSRVQTVDAAWNQKYHALLVAFKKRTGISLLLNTSFNRKGMPIVETPTEALDFFYSSPLDYLVLGQFIIGK